MSRQPYSIDFRQKIIEVREKENISLRKLAASFKVSKSFVQKNTGSSDLVMLN
ncbi:MAG: hypothetical protein F6K10_14645 [Moorea sp. SIO2B7]|nr:hypothetical protein [Moorena sp. SIO2B7]